ncbi:hypothetical protein L0F63_003097 [Massospora cicadina]|nr:hypothetical protein L0F63_003097 [Massospora cicadina]
MSHPPAYLSPDLKVGRSRIAGQKLRPQSMIIINERAKDLEQARLQLRQQHGFDGEDLLSDQAASASLSSLASLSLKGGSRKVRLPATQERVQAALQLIKANIHTHQPSAHSLLWSEDRLIIDLGSMYIKYGFSSNPTPQFTLSVYAKSLSPAFKYVEKRRRTLLLENPFFPIKLKNIIAKVLFQRFQVSAITFLPSQLMALLSTGESQGLVVDVGNLETTVIAVFDGRPLCLSSITSPLAGKEVNLHLKKLLLAYASVKRSSRLAPRPYTAASSTHSSVPDVTLTPSMLTLQLLEEIKTRLLFVNKARSPAPVSLADPDLEERCLATSQATAVVFPFRFKGEGYDLTIPGWIREHAYDVLFDASEGLDRLTPPQAALECLRRISSDLRASLFSKILLTGGTSASSNFAYRFQLELLDLLSRPRYASLRPLGDRLALLNSIPAAASFSPAHHAWVGAAVACGIRGVNEQVTADAFDPTIPVPDWITGYSATLVA